MRGEQPKASVLKGLKVSDFVSLTRSRVPKRLGACLSCPSLVSQSLTQSQADSVFAEGVTKLMPALHPPCRVYEKGATGQRSVGGYSFRGMYASIHACTQEPGPLVGSANSLLLLTSVTWGIVDWERISLEGRQKSQDKARRRHGAQDAQVEMVKRDEDRKGNEESTSGPEPSPTVFNC